MDTFNQMFLEKFLCMTLLNLKYRGWFDKIFYTLTKKNFVEIFPKGKTLLYEHQCNNGSTEINFRKIFYNMRGNSLCRPRCLVMILITILSYEQTWSFTFLWKWMYEKLQSHEVCNSEHSNECINLHTTQNEVFYVKKTKFSSDH